MNTLDSSATNSAFGTLKKLCLLGLFLFPALVVAQQNMQKRMPSAADLLKEANYYHGIDDTTDRAADGYRQLIAQYSASPQAEQAQFYLGTYYQKKFFILEDRTKVQDWTSFNQAEAALNNYIQKYSAKGSRTFLADAYFTLAIIALRRGDNARAKQLLTRMKSEASKDGTVYLSKIVWSSNADDTLKVSCNSKQLASDTLDIISTPVPFSQIVKKLRDRCRQNCRAGA